MTHSKSDSCCVDLGDLCKDFKCEVKEHEHGVCICLSSEDASKVEALKARMKSCCESGTSGSCC